MKDKLSRCVVCSTPFVKNDMFQAFLRSPEKPEGAWTMCYEVDEGYQERLIKNNDKVSRKHAGCDPMGLPAPLNTLRMWED